MRFKTLLCHFFVALWFLGILSAIPSYAQVNNATNTRIQHELKKGFANPTGTARPKVYWWWLNGYTDQARLKEELVAVKNAGLGGVDLFEIGVPPASDPNHIIPAGPAFMSDSSLKMIQFAINEAGKLGLEVGLNLASSWNAGGSWVEPRFASKTLYYSKTTASSKEAAQLRLPFPTITPDRTGKPRLIEYGKDGKPVFRQEVAVIAVPAGAQNLADTSGIVNVTAFYNAETEILSWKAPAGNWDIYRYICSNSGEQLIRPSEKSAGPILDHFDSTATEMHLMYFINKLKPLLGDFSKTALKNLYLASYEAKEFAWTTSLPAAFKRINGYDIYKFLPAIYDQKLFAKKTADTFNTDFLETFSELMIHNHYKKAKEISNKYGLKIISEAGGPGHMHHIPVETLKALGSLDVPRGEFWYKRPYFDKEGIVDMVWLVKEIAAAANIYKLGIAEEEAFTSYLDWQEGPADLKTHADRAFSEGMNRLVIHGFPHNPKETGHPGIAYFAGTHFNDRNTWWPKIKPFNDYLSRISYIFQNAKFAADVLYYYGDDIPNLVPPKNIVFKAGNGFDYEVMNTEILLRDLTVENGEWVLPGVGRYKVLSIGKSKTVGAEAQAKLDKLKKQGGVIVNENVSAALNIPPDFAYNDQDKGTLDYIHYRRDKQDFYLIRNATDAWVSRQCAFRQENKVPEIWDPVTGKVHAVSVFEQRGKQMHMPLTLPPFGTYFVVFTEGTARPHFTEITSGNANPPLIAYAGNQLTFLEAGNHQLKTGKNQINITHTPEKLEIKGEWNLSFPERWGAPAQAVFPELISWPDAEQKGIKYFSGIATYAKEFTFKMPEKGKRIYLDLGQVSEVAEVWLNDKPLGISWTLPHRFDITNFVINGENKLRVEVANTWSNRLTGDAITGEKFTKTNIVKANKNLTPWAEVPLKKSGLLGPVTIVSIQTVQP
ncbi:glycosyl hydrolase [Dyadobacter sp. Leaf189]|uniref:glycosyl hydrolase n=1 Tax=Dyadobacter sp. Leaf189 TaxID=1736295 RepID=UPI0006F76BEE|nr:glycosyl hydrolase [Dyadobacter sp. Leaf189]KQS33854.1 hypothetical protein ASG33_07370 [Dyadobacter sp. Leaf189]